jgi:hypothetical protein
MPAYKFVAAVAAFLAAAMFAVAPARAADQLSPAAFYGTWSGGGVSENKDSIYFHMTARDIDVTVEPVGQGFKIAWTTVIRRGGDPNKPNVRKVKTERIFVPTRELGVWRCTDSGDPLAGKELCWARIEERTLSVRQMVLLDRGIYEIQQYDRTLGATGMQLYYTLLRDGGTVRTVSGRLVKVGK